MKLFIHSIKFLLKIWNMSYACIKQVCSRPSIIFSQEICTKKVFFEANFPLDEYCSKVSCLPWEYMGALPSAGDGKSWLFELDLSSKWRPSTANYELWGPQNIWGELITDLWVFVWALLTGASEQLRVNLEESWAKFLESKVPTWQEKIKKIIYLQDKQFGHAWILLLNITTNEHLWKTYILYLF